MFEPEAFWLGFDQLVRDLAPEIVIGIPNRDFAMFPDSLPETVKLPNPKLFIVKANVQDPSANDQKSLDLLGRLYPQGSLSLHQSPVPGHDFWVYFVPQ